jgi:RecA-family ATPase
MASLVTNKASQHIQARNEQLQGEVYQDHYKNKKGKEEKGLLLH